MTHYKCIACQYIQRTGRVCRRCGSYSLSALETHDSASEDNADNRPAAAATPYNMPVWISLVGIAILTSYLLVFYY